MIIKPQLAVLLPVAVIAGRYWSAIPAAAASASALLVAAALVFGWDSYRGFLDVLPAYQSVLVSGRWPWEKLASVFASRSLVRCAGVARLGDPRPWSRWRLQASSGSRGRATGTPRSQSWRPPRCSFRPICSPMTPCCWWRRWPGWPTSGRAGRWGWRHFRRCHWRKPGGIYSGPNTTPLTAFGSSLGCIAIIYFSMFADKASQRRSLSEFLHGLWVIVGIVMATILSSAGPCFLELIGHPYADRYHIPMDDAPNAVRAQKFLVDSYKTGSVGLAHGISAMPSVHVAIATVMALAVRGRLQIVAWLYWAVILIGSVSPWLALS